MHIAFEWWNGMCIVELENWNGIIQSTFSIWDARFIFSISFLHLFLFESFKRQFYSGLVTSCEYKKKTTTHSHGIQFIFVCILMMESTMWMCSLLWPDKMKTYASHMFFSTFKRNAIITKMLPKTFEIESKRRISKKNRPFMCRDSMRSAM